MTPALSQFIVRFSVVSAFTVLLSACFGGGTPEAPNETTSSSSSVAYVPTPNVTYSGTVEELGASIYMEGTHQLTLSTGGFILLSASDQGMDLDRYLGREVQVRGSVRPTTEGDAVHMQVTEVIVEGDEESSSSEASEESSSSSSESTNFCGGIAGVACPDGQECVDDPSDSCDPENGGADCAGVCRAASSSSESSESSSESSVESSSSSSSSSISKVSSHVSEEMITLMASQDYAAGLWTQQYCTGHIAFCIPVHKNWYFKSFGATTSNLWHVEFSMEAVDSLNTAPIILNLVDSTVEEVGATDGALQTHGSEVIGFKAWTDDTHFEIIADARLQTAVSYMLSQITPYSPEE